MSAELPKLPEPLTMVAQFWGEWRETTYPEAQPVYTAAQMREYAQEAARQAMEKCASHLESFKTGSISDVVIQAFADEIRLLPHDSEKRHG